MHIQSYYLAKCHYNGSIALEALNSLQQLGWRPCSVCSGYAA
jgi:hypothetical protein